MNFAVVKEKAHELFAEASFISHIDNEADYQKALALMDELIEDYDACRPLVEVLSMTIERWESSAEEFKGFNERVDKLSDVAILKVLMEQHELGVSDLPEIGSKSLVSKILNGKGRNLTKDHILLLSKRFGVSPAVFFGAAG